MPPTPAADSDVDARPEAHVAAGAPVHGRRSWASRTTSSSPCRRSSSSSQSARPARLDDLGRLRLRPRLAAGAWSSWSSPASRKRHGVPEPWAVPLFALIPPPRLPPSPAPGSAAWSPYSPIPAARRWGLRLLGLGLFAFTVWHLPPLWEVLAGPVVWKRMISWDAPWWLDLPLHLWSLFLLAVLGWNAQRAWYGHVPLSAGERTLALWPWAYMACFSLFRNTSSLRYSPGQYLGLMALAAGWRGCRARSPRRSRRRSRWSSFRPCSGANSPPQDRRSCSSRRLEVGELLGLRAQGHPVRGLTPNACGVVRRNGVSSPPLIPVLFHQNTRRRGDDGILFDADDCRDCATPPSRWEVLR